MNMRLFVRRLLSSLTASRRDRQPLAQLHSSLRDAVPDAPPSVPPAYMPLYTYLERRYATTVVLTFGQIEALLGFAPPARAFADATWWTDPCATTDGHTAAWVAAHRSAASRLDARLVTFERLS